MFNRSMAIGLFVGMVVWMVMLSQSQSVSAAATQDRYAEAISEIDQLIRSEMKKNEIQGFSVALVDENGIFWSKGYGHADYAKREKATVQTLYRAGSVTKTFTALGIMLLADRGLVELDAPAEQYLPGFTLRSRFAETKPITVRQLLTHHAGLMRDLYRDIRGANPPGFDVVVEALRESELAFPPDTRFGYSNVGYVLLGKLIENVSGKEYARFMEEEIFRPLGMTRTEPDYTQESAGRIAKSYKMTGWIWKRPREIEQFAERDIPAGAMVSSAEDLSKFLQMIFNDGKTQTGETLVSREGLREMFVNPYTHLELDYDSYGLGWEVNKSKIPHTELNIRHGGTLTGYSSLIAALPQEKLGIVIFYNTNNAFSRHYIANKALEALVQAKQGLTPSGPAADEERDRVIRIGKDAYADYAGRYISLDEIPLIFDLSARGSKLSMKFQGFTLTLSPVGEQRFRVVKELLWFQIGVGWVLGVDDVFVDFYRAQDGTVYPRLIFRYEDIEMKIFSEKVTPEPLPADVDRIVGRYELRAEDRAHTYADSFTYVKLKADHGWLHMETKMEGNTIELLLKPLDERRYVALGTGEIVEIVDGVLRYSGFVFERK